MSFISCPEERRKVNAEQEKEYVALVDAITEKMGAFMFWYNPVEHEHFDNRMKINVRNRMAEGATLRDFLHVLNVRCREYEDHKNLTKIKIIGFFSRGNFWKAHRMREGGLPLKS